jgi:hypothetical protein
MARRPVACKSGLNNQRSFGKTFTHRSPIGDVYVVTYTPTSVTVYKWSSQKRRRTKWCKTDSGNVVLLDDTGGLSTSVGMSELERVYACLKNSGGGDGVRPRDSDFGVPGIEVRCGSMRIDA